MSDHDESNNSNAAAGLESLAIQASMSTKDGRHFMWRILEQSCVFANGFNPDPYIHAKNSGNRQIGLWLVDELKNAAFGSYMTMLKEHEDD